MNKLRRLLYALPLLAMASCANLKAAEESVTPPLINTGVSLLQALEAAAKFILGLLPGFFGKLFGQ
jgi:uncharacterized membrane protein